MSQRKFYTPEEIRPIYDQIVPVYQEAFAGYPWYEVSKCVDKEQRCDGGFSPVAIGERCQTCGDCPASAAYEPQELIDKFDWLAATKPTSWYIEQNECGITLAAVAWSATADTIATERYADVPAMSQWLRNTLKSTEVIWLDEVFANKKIRPYGNLQNFGEMVVGFARRLERPTVAYRTITPQMIKKPIKVFGESVKLSPRKTVELPDRRDFVRIDLREEL